MMDRKRTVPASDAGFTVLELLLALAITIGAAALVLPRIGAGPDRYTVRSAALSILAALQTARSEAIAGSREVVLTIDLEGRRYWADGAVKVRRIPAGIAIAAGHSAGNLVTTPKAAIRFRPDGTASGGWIGLESRSASASIAIDWLTGTATLAWAR